MNGKKLDKVTNLYNGKQESSSSVIQGFFMTVQTIQSRQQTVNQSFQLISTACFFLIVSFNMAGRNVFKELDLVSLVINYSQSLTVIGSIMLVVLIAVHTFNFHYSRKSIKTNGLLEVSIYMTITFTYIIYPLIVFLVSSTAFLDILILKKTSSLGLLYIGLCTFIIGGMVIFTYLRMRNHFPSKSLMCNIMANDQLKIYFLTIIAQLCCSYRNFGITSSDSLKYWILTFVSNLILVFIIYKITCERVFWNLEMNDFIERNYCRLLTMKLIFEFYQNSSTFHQLLAFSVLQLLSTKLLQTISDSLLEIDIFGKEVPPRRLVIGSVLLDFFIKHQNRESLSVREKRLHCYYNGLYTAYQDKTRLNDTSVLDTKKDASQVHKFLISYLETFPNPHISLVKLMLMLRVITILPYLKSIKPSIEKIKKLNGTGIFAAFETYQYVVLIESKLDALYKGKIKDDEGPSMPRTVFQNFEVISTYINKKEEVEYMDNPNYIDIEKSFKAIDRHKKIATRIEAVLMVQQNIFDGIGEKADQSGKVFIKMNETIYKLKRSLAEQICLLDYEPDIYNLYSYFYPLLIFYYSLIKYDLVNSDKMIRIYQKKLYQIIYCLSKPMNATKGIRIEVDTVTLKVEMVKEALGKITDASLNYADFLGQVSRKTLIGMNVSAFLPSSFHQSHFSKMYSLNSFYGMNTHRQLLMIDFKGCLRAPHGSVKFLPSISVSVSAMALLTFDFEKRYNFMLANEEYKLVGADPLLTELLEQANTPINNPNANLESICPDIVSTIKLLHLYEKMTNPKPEVQKIPLETAFKKSLIDSMKDMVERSSTTGIVYILEPGSPLYSVLGERKLIVKIEFHEYFGNKFIKIIINSSCLDSGLEASFNGMKEMSPDVSLKKVKEGLRNLSRPNREESNSLQMTNRANESGIEAIEFIPFDSGNGPLEEKRGSHPVNEGIHHSDYKDFGAIISSAEQLIQNKIQKVNHQGDNFGGFNFMGHLSVFINDVFEEEPDGVKELVELFSHGMERKSTSKVRNQKENDEKSQGSPSKHGDFFHLFSVPLNEKEHEGKPKTIEAKSISYAESSEDEHELKDDENADHKKKLKPTISIFSSKSKTKVGINVVAPQNKKISTSNTFKMQNDSDQFQNEKDYMIQVPENNEENKKLSRKKTLKEIVSAQNLKIPKPVTKILSENINSLQHTRFHVKPGSQSHSKLDVVQSNLLIATSTSVKALLNRAIVGYIHLEKRTH